MRIAFLVLGRTLVSLAVLAGFGGVLAIAHPIALAYLAVEAVWSLVEGTLARGDLAQTREQVLRAKGAHSSATATRFLFLGKRYFLANLLYQIVVLAEFARRASATPRDLTPVSGIGLAIYLTGAIVRGSAMAVMGERFKSWTVSREARGLETGGPYAIVRHPAYLGLVLIALALPFIFGEPWLLLAAPLPVMTIAARVAPEEQLLREAYIDQYPSYAARTRFRLIPGIW